MKKIILIAIFAFVSCQTNAQDLYGSFYGLHLYAYKSNLFNSDDLRADSFQTYKFTPGIAGSFEYGYLYENGFSISGGLQFGTNNQKYSGSDNKIPYTMTATSKLSFLKIPLIMGKQALNDKKMKFLYTWGFYYAYNTGYSDYMMLDYGDSKIKNYEQNLSSNTYTSNLVGDTNKVTYDMSKRPYKRSSWGALASVGFNYRIGKKTDFVLQVKGEYSISNIEVNDEVEFTPTGSTAITEKPKLSHAFGDYAKYMTSGVGNYNRAATHPFNIGLSFGIRHYLFHFDD